jgi:transcriptional regulator with XRE-family HTH domain
MTKKKFDVLGAKKRIFEARRKKGLSQEELGDVFGMSKAGYSAAENTSNAKLFFTFEQILNIKYVLGLSFDYIIEGIDGAYMKVERSDEAQAKEKPLSNLEQENKWLLDKLKDKDELIAALRDQIAILKKP